MSDTYDCVKCARPDLYQKACEIGWLVDAAQVKGGDKLREHPEALQRLAAEVEKAAMSLARVVTGTERTPQAAVTPEGLEDPDEWVPIRSPFGEGYHPTRADFDRLGFRDPEKALAVRDSAARTEAGEQE